MRRTRYRRASEIQEFVYCHRAWWLHHVEGNEPANVAARQRGTRAHAAHSTTLRWATRLQRLALLFLLIALLLLLREVVGQWR